MEDKHSVFSGAGFYTALTVCLLAAVVGGYYLMTKPQEEPAQTTADAAMTTPEVPKEHPVSAPVPLETQPVEDTPEPEETAQEEEPPAAVQTVQDDTPVVAAVPKLVVAPLEGEIVAAFSVDALAYDATMQDWRTHDGVDIAAAVGTSVLAASGGVVSEVQNDPLMGMTVVLTQDDGYQTTYANLETGLAVSKGEQVSAGQVLGTVGTTAAAESAQEPHLHFAVSKDGDAVDPETYLEQNG